MSAPRDKGAILVIRGGAIGDFILTLPVFAALRRHFPDTRLEVLAYPHIAQLGLQAGVVDAVRHIESRALSGFFAEGGTLDPALQDYFAHFAIVISYLYDPDGIFRSNVGRCTGAQFIAGHYRPAEQEGRHATQVLLEPLQRLAIFDPDPVPRLPRVRASATPAKIAFPPCLAVHPGSGSERKNWPEARWHALLVELVRVTDARLLLVGGEAEGARLDRLAALVPATRLEVARNRPLVEVAPALASATAFVGHDSGLSHLAAALGVPTLVLWGPTLESVWRPLGEHVTVLKPARGLSALTVDEVLPPLTAMLRRR